ncbi:MAG: alpha amylase catalytic region [Rhodospirillales bacterium]|nr:alpha amylase catalytic region [Rhodospirillales bacterium]
MPEPVWWQRGIVYQIYPRSFMDSNGDGIGDLPGIRQRLDYLTWLGVDAIWISPVYPSPMADFGYDISNYVDIHPVFGTLEEFDRLLAEAHQRGLKLILDFVPNHTSDQHPWFLESRSSRTNPRRDWYIWADPRPGGGPPNNWLSDFGGTAWEFDERSGQYYYHAFLREQPDLNWRNPAVCQAMHDVLRFWLRRGVDGFRVDVIWYLIKDDQLRDNPPNPAYSEGEPPHHAVLPLHTADRPEIHAVVAGLRRVIDEFTDRVLIGEIYLPIERLVSYYGADLSGAHLPFNFQLIQTQWNARAIAALIDSYEAALPPGGWPNWVLGNHDKSRIATRIGAAQARAAAMLLLTVRGTPTMYYGDEIGMTDVPIPRHLLQDPFERNVPGIGCGRDPERTPMQWDASPGAGFTTGRPWLPFAPDWQETNVATQAGLSGSILTLCRRLIALRRAEPALAVGSYSPVHSEGDVLAYIREGSGRRFLVALNLASRPAQLTMPAGATARMLLTTYLDREGEIAPSLLPLRPDEGVILDLSQ